MSTPPSDKPKRRPRYRGTHPRHFKDKYKEHAADPETLRKVTESGRTPAGTHRSICLNEILEILDPQPGDVAVDATLGYGGHSSALLGKLRPGGRLIGIDADPLELPKTEARMRAQGFTSDEFAVFNLNFSSLATLLKSQGIGPVDLILADLGLSSMQIDNPDRGFTFKFDGPLDLRLNPEKGEPASALLARLSEARLIEILAENSDEPHARQIARALVERRKQGPITTTQQLADAVRAEIKKFSARVREKEGDTPIRRAFQALRIEVNNEFGVLDSFLESLPSCLRPGGRVAILTFHSGEDRRVKKSFQEGLRQGVYADVARDIIRASPEEQRANPRSSSAKLRWAVKAPANQRSAHLLGLKRGE